MPWIVPVLFNKLNHSSYEFGVMSYEFLHLTVNQLPSDSETRNSKLETRNK